MLFQVQAKSKMFGSFPLDMLRYDCCTPANSDDAVKIASTLRGERITELPIIQLRTHEPRLDITPARWESFGWKVIEGRR
ncbi:MAG: hypothetical protein DRI97_03935 [Bacteroidetes bacterium]|nr:MAG: hypothetical protein DRQ42_00450 [Gammaproteobacteria bacterium]RLD58105.1 MAG: hypothetical protein DRI97_03935 [Bacteroidota bacterium]